MPDTPPAPDPSDDMAKHRAEAAIEEFRAAVVDADIEFVGADHDYVPDGPRARAGHPNAEDD